MPYHIPAGRTAFLDVLCLAASCCLLACCVGAEFAVIAVLVVIGIDARNAVKMSEVSMVTV